VRAPTDNLLDVENLRVSFGTERGVAEVLDGVNLTIGRGEIVGLVGESGCGKTTLAHAILGILAANARHDAGTIRFGGEDLLTMPRRRFDNAVRGRRITFIPQDPFGSFNPLFPIGAQTMEVMKWKSPRRGAGEWRGLAGFFSRYPRARRRADTAAAVDMLRTVQIPKPQQTFAKLPHEFSGGQRQRLMIALALLPQPELVIADEPTTALDVTIQAQILKLLRQLAKERGISVLFTTHDMGTAYEICDRITVMYAGQEVETAPIEEFFRRPSHPYTVRLLESLPRPGRELAGIGGEIPALVDPPPGCRFHPRCTRASDECRAERPGITHLGEHLTDARDEGSPPPPERGRSTREARREGIKDAACDPSPDRPRRGETQRQRSEYRSHQVRCYHPIGTTVPA
jgi:peptide/nickel transport system ATP-binding protein